MPAHALTPAHAPWLARVREVLGEPLESVRPDESGEVFFVLEVNQRWIFRFARQEISNGALAQEMRFLAAFGPEAPVAVPQYRWSGPGFGGYRKLPGRRLDRAALAGLPEADRAAIAAQFGQFLAVLHGFPLEQARRLRLSTAWNGEQARDRAHFWQALAGRLSPAGRRYAHQADERFQALASPPAVIHGDFSTDHWLYDPATRRLSGILDFGDLTIYDPAYDFKGLRWEFDARFFRQVVASYGLERDPGLLERLEVQMAIHPLLAAANGALYGFPQRLEQALAEIERRAVQD